MKKVFNYKNIGLTFLMSVFGVYGFGQANNNPCNNAPMLTVSTNCTYTTGTTANATQQTNAANFGTPSCGSMGNDVWYGFVAPLSGGGVTIDTQSGVVTDGVMAVYSSDCASTYAELGCDDDGGTGLMPTLSFNNLNPGETYYIRFWEYGGDNDGTFDICVQETPPPPPGTNNENCSQMTPICTDAGISFTANTGVDDADILDPGNNYDCLFSQPNPTWFFLQIETAGTIDMNLTAASDIDYAIWGPYPSLGIAQADCGDMGFNPNNVVDCSYSGTNDEYPTIPGAQVGEVYVMLITNYANVTQQIDLQQTGGTGATDCDIVFPSCTIDNFTSNISACDPATNTYSINGTIDFTDPPTTGQLIVEDCNGNQQVINPPFGTSANYNLTGLLSDGAACDVTCYFTDDLNCTQTLNYTAPADCSPACNMTSLNVLTGACDPGSTLQVSGTVDYVDPPSTGQLIVEDCQGNQVAFNPPFGTSTNFLFQAGADGSTCAITAYFTDDAACTISVNGNYPPPCGCTVSTGTYTITVDGNPVANNDVLCFGESFVITPNGDEVLPAEATAPPIGAPGQYAPGLGYLLFSCPPTILPPGAIETDPCFVGLLGYGSFADNNGLGQASYGGPWTGADETMYIIPITFYDTNTATYSYVNTTDACWDIGPVISMQYLSEITFTEVQDCDAGTQTVTISGGLPEMTPGEIYTASNLNPGNANFINNTTTHGGDIVIDGLVDGDVVTFDIVDGNGCPLSITLAPFQGPEDPSFTYPQYTYCSADTDPTAAITGDPGSFTSTPAGLDINPTTGLIDLDGSAPNTYTITYTTNGGITCASSTTALFTINETPTVDPVADQTLCVGENTTLVTFTGTPAGVTYDWVSDNTGTGVGANGAATIPVFTSINPSTVVPEISVITVTPTLGTCVGTPTNFSYIVNPLPTIDAGPDLNICVGTNVTLTATGGTVYTWDQGLGVGNNFNVSPATTTTYIVTGLDAAGCAEDDTITVNVGSFTPTISNDTNICAGNPANISAFGGVTYTWDQGVGAGQAHSVAPGATTTYTVTATDAGGCVGNASVTVTIDPLPTVDPIADQSICIGANTTLVTFTGSAGATFDWVSDNTGTGVGAAGSTTVPVFAGLNPNVGIPEISTITVTPTSAAGCVGTPETFTYTINPLPNIDAGPDASICVGGNAVLTGNGGATYVWDNGLGAGNNFNVSPAVATTYVVVGTDANGCVEDDTIVVNVGSLIPTISPAITICNGEDTTITANGGATYTWDQGLGAGQSHLVSPVATTTYTVTATDAGGCVGNASVTVTVNPLPNVVADPDDAICIGDDVTFGVAGAVNYVWDNGLPATATLTISPLVTTTYTVTGTDANGCVNTDQIIITVNALPNIDAGPDLNICTGSNATLTGTGGATYVWDNGLGAGNNFNVSPVAATTYIVVGTDANGCVEDDTITVNVGAFIPTASNDTTICVGESYTMSGFGGATYDWDQGLGAGQTHTVSPLVTTIYTVTGTDAGGCQGTATVTVTVNPLPNVVADPDSSICINDNMDISATGAQNYVWDNGLGNGQTHNVAPVATTTYIVTGTDANGCVNTDQIIVTVDLLPIVDAGLDQTVCPVEMVTLNASGAVNYVWDNGVTDGVAFAAPGTNTIYTVTGTDANGCVNTDDLLVTVATSPPVDAGPDTTMCIGESFVLNGAGADTYDWDQGLGIGQTHTVSPIVTTQYIVTGTTLAGCVGADTVVVTINALPIVDAGLDQTVCEGANVTLNGAGATNYVWDNGALDGVSFVATVSETYTVIGTDANGCVNTSQMDVFVNLWDDSTFTYDASTYCVTGTDPVLNLTGTPGGAFTVTPAGLTLDGATGAITLLTSIDGSYSVTYTTPGVCPTAQTIPIEITNTAVADFTFAQYCLNGTDPAPTFINGGTGGVFTVPAGVIIDPITGIVDLDASTPGIHTITNDINIVGCAAVQATFDIEIYDLPTATISGGGTVCQGEPLPDVQFDMTGSGDWTIGYSYSQGGGGLISTTSNPHIISNATEGQYGLVTITDNATGCSNVAAGIVDVIVNQTPIVQQIADAGICHDDQHSVPGFMANIAGTTFDWVNIGDDVGFGLAGSGNIGSFTASNTTGAPLIAFIEVTPTAGGCVGPVMTFKITVNPLPIIDMQIDINPTCLPVNAVFTNNGTPGTTCLWSFGDGSTDATCGLTNHLYTSDGCYDVSLTVSDGIGCSNSETVVDAVCLEPNPIANFVFDPAVTDVSDTEIQFENLSEHASSYTWDFGDGSGTSNLENPVHIYSDTAQEYVITLVAENDLGCTDTAVSKIVIRDVLLYWVPNAFTPDNDEFNQTFKPIFTSGFDPFDYELLIFDRWGELIFESHNSEVGWDGRYMGNYVQDGVYVWKIEFKETMTDKRHKKYGHVSILR
jgi:gliding motility-associated-like protein